MHELSVTESILSIALDYANKNHASRITSVNLKIGRLASIVDDSVTFYWNILARGTLCENAELQFERIPARLVCMDCGREYEILQDMTPCTHCNSVKVKVISGNEFSVDSIEIEKE